MPARILLVACFFGLLLSALPRAHATTATATAAAFAARKWRPNINNFVPIYTNYRYHSRERRGFFKFLRFRHRQPGVRHRGTTTQRSSGHSSRKHVLGLF